MSLSKIIGGMGVTLWADSRPFNKGIKEARDQIKLFNGSMTQGQLHMKRWQESMVKNQQQIKMLGTVTKSVLVAGLVVAAKFVQNTTRSFDTLNTSMTRSLSIFGKVSAETRKSMTESVLSVSGSTLFDSSQAAAATRFIGSAGYDAEQSEALLPQFAQFAQAGMMEMSDAVNFAADAQAALGLKSKDTAKNLENLTRITDVLTKANIISNAEVSDFSAALTNRTAGALRLVNKDLEEGVAVLAAFAEQGIKGEAAGESFGIVLRDLQTKSIKNAEAFKAMGIAVFDSSGNMNNIADIIEDVENALSGMSDEQKKSTLLGLDFADKSVAYIQTLIGMSDKIRDYEAQLREAGGVTKEVSDVMMTDAEKAIRRNAEAWDRLSASVGGALKVTERWNNAKAALWENMAVDPGAGMTMSERLGSALPWNWEAPELPGSKEQQVRQAKEAEAARSKAMAEQFHKTWGGLLSDPMGTIKRAGGGQAKTPGAIGSAVGGAMDAISGAGRFVGNTYWRGKSTLEGQKKERQDSWDNFTGGIADAVMSGDNAKNVRDIGGAIWDGVLSGIGEIPSLYSKAGFAAAMFIPEKEEKKPMDWRATRSPLSFAESGSVESYRQQAAIRSQQDAMKLDKDRNSILGKILVAMEKQPGLAPAGLG